MDNINVNTDLHSKYDNQYFNEDGGWRELGAKFKAENILEISQGYTFNKVLEVGAGEGSILKNLSLSGFGNELYALEISESGIQKIKEKNIDKLKEALLFNGYQIPYPDDYFDLVVLSHVLEHVEFERILLREIKRVSRYQIIEVPRDYRTGVDAKVKHFLSYGHINVYTPSSIKFLLKTEGFEILKENLKVFDREVFEYLGKSRAGKFKSISAFYFKKIMINLPIRALSEKYCNTITLLLKN